jgi:hypothetical protein
MLSLSVLNAVIALPLVENQFKTAADTPHAYPFELQML